MFSIVRIFVAFHAAAYLALVGLTPATSLALATPFPMPMMMAKNHSSSLQDEAGPLPKSPKTPSNSSASHSTPAPPAPRTLIPFFMRSIYPRQEFSSLFDVFYSARDNSQSLRMSNHCLPRIITNVITTEKCSCSDSNQQLPSSYLGLFSGNLLDFQNGVEGADPGKKCMASYNKNSGLQKLLEDLLNLIKDTLTYLNDLINCTPLLLPLCQPRVSCSARYLSSTNRSFYSGIRHQMFP